MAHVQIGYAPGTNLHTAWARDLPGLMRAIEEAGLDHVVVGDHVSFIVGLGMDGLLFATALAASHATLPIHTAVYLLPLRHPLVVARQISSLDVLAPGRLVFGVGIGGEDRREVANCGIDPTTRGRRMNECLEVLRPLLRGETVNYTGAFIELEDAAVLPAPAEVPPILVGGRSRAAIERAARLGDGWIAVWVSSRRFAAEVARIEEAVAEARREQLDALRHELLVWCGLADQAGDARHRVATAMQTMYQIPFERFEKWSPHGTPEQVAEFLIPYVDAGCSSFDLLVPAPPGHEEEAVGLAGEVAKLIRGG